MTGYKTKTFLRRFVIVTSKESSAHTATARFGHANSILVNSCNLTLLERTILPGGRSELTYPVSPRSTLS